jgi:fatty acid synthase subunit alpha
VAAKGSIVKDEPVKELLGNINSILIQRLLERKYNGDEASIPTIDYLSPPSRTPIDLLNVKRLNGKDEVTYEIGEAVPEATLWLETLAGDKLNWLRAFITFPTFVQGSSFVDNPIRRILAPRAGQRVIITSSGGLPSSVTVHGAARSYGAHKPSFKAVEIQYDSTSKLIDMTMYEERQDTSVPLSLQFEYKPSNGFAPIHEIATGRNSRIKQFYWKLWYGDDAVLPTIDIHETFIGPEVVIEATAVETFCAVVGNQGESFKTVRNDVVNAPMDFAIVTGWKVSYFYDESVLIDVNSLIFFPKAIMKAIFPSVIDGDLLKLVHLSNGFRMMEGATPLQVGDVCRAEARIVSVTNANEGKIVKVKGHVYRGTQPVIEVVSAFLYRGRFTDYENTFETTEEPNYIVALETDADVGVLQSKEWFGWENVSPLLAGTSLIFRIRSQVFFKDKSSFRNVSVSGEVFVRDQLKNLIKVGSIDFQRDDSHGNPVVAYLQRFGSPEGLVAPLFNDGYSLTKSDDSTSFNAPLTNEPYSCISGDFNPIHVNPYFSDYASLPATITHGLWSSAATRKYVENVVAKGHPNRVLA